MFESWGQWGWVALAWAQLVLFYGGYQLYLSRRLKRLEEEAPSND